jgi:Protein of unknown function, DUF547
MMRLVPVVLALVLGTFAVSLRAQDPVPPPVDPLHQGLDTILDIYVRDGLVYYRALKLERPRFDAYVASLAAASIPADRNRQLAFWINAYNAFVLRTVIDFYPITGRAAMYPRNSIRQVPGSFEKRPFRAAGRTVTLDQIEKDIIVPMGDARALLALGRGALSGGRLRSEAYTAERLDAQLDAVSREAVDRHELVKIDRENGVLSVNAMFSWREAAFVQSFADKAPPAFAARSPLERAVLGLIRPTALRTELDFLEQNRFSMQFHDFDWRLNDLTGR